MADADVDEDCFMLLVRDVWDKEEEGCGCSVVPP